MADAPQLRIEYLPIDALVPYERNSKEHPDAQVDQIAASIREFGDCDPIGIWHGPDGAAHIVEGHGRVLALKRLGATTAPCVSLDHLTDGQRRAYSHVHNQTTLTSGLDMGLVAVDMAELDAFDWGSFGFERASETMAIDVDDLEDGSAADITVSVLNHSFYVARDEAEMLIEGFRQYAEGEGSTYGYLRGLLDAS